jgi:hypothetical protein
LNSCDSCFYVIGKLRKSYDSGRLFMPSLGTMDFQCRLISNGYATVFFGKGKLCWIYQGASGNRAEVFAGKTN